MASPAFAASPLATASTPAAFVGSPSVAAGTPRAAPGRGAVNEAASHDAALADFRQRLGQTTKDATAALALVEQLQQRMLLAYSGDGGPAPAGAALSLDRRELKAADVYDQLSTALASLQSTLTATGIGALDASVGKGPAELAAMLERRQREDADAAARGQRAREAAKIAADALRPR